MHTANRILHSKRRGKSVEMASDILADRCRSQQPLLEALCQRVIACRRCPRLVRHRERTAQEKVRRYRDYEYWGRPVPGFGDPRARLLVVGLAPAAHGGNRTGRIFTGDRSGDFLFAALHGAVFANQPRSIARGDGLEVRDCYVTAAVRSEEHTSELQSPTNLVCRLL